MIERCCRRNSLSIDKRAVETLIILDHEIRAVENNFGMAPRNGGRGLIEDHITIGFPAKPNRRLRNG